MTTSSNNRTRTSSPPCLVRRANTRAMTKRGSSGSALTDGAEQPLPAWSKRQPRGWHHMRSPMKKCRRGASRTLYSSLPKSSNSCCCASLPDNTRPGWKRPSVGIGSLVCSSASASPVLLGDSSSTVRSHAPSLLSCSGTSTSSTASSISCSAAPHSEPKLSSLVSSWMSSHASGGSGAASAADTSAARACARGS
eukprot:scaffold282062_cov36-Tisochrysis_lutea.AAC.2